MARDPYKYFRQEARELLAQFSAGILEIEKNGKIDGQIQHLLRVAHTLKGAARVVKQQDIADRAHAIEDVLTPLRDATGAPSRECVDAVLKHIDEIGMHIRALDGAEPPTVAAGASATPVAGVADDLVRTVRADIAEMDGLLDGVVETHRILNRLRGLPSAVERALHVTDLIQAQVAPRPGVATSHQSTITFERVLAASGDLRKTVAGIKTTLEFAVEQMDRELQQLRDSAEQLRLASADALFMSLERMVRETARSQGKEAILESSGGDIRLDAHVLGTVQGALVQVVRNAIAHGIESSQERRAAGKPSVGLIVLDVSRRGRQVVFRCQDDGRGIDLDAVRRVAIQRGLLTDNKSPSTEELVKLLLRGGISTSSSVTEAAGRGVGLDVVRESIEKLGGQVLVHTENRKGTTFELSVPIFAASLDVLVVETAGDLVTVPLGSVVTSLRIEPEQISWSATGASIIYEKEAIPFSPLAGLLFGARPPASQAWSTLVVASGSARAAIGVDRLHGTTRVVVRPLSELAAIAGLIAGASLDAEGNPQLVMDPDALVAEASGRRVDDFEAAPARRPILVIDDSLTTRMLEQSILESAGYEVDIAASGEEGLERARRKRYALILCDIEMPGIDGFIVVERLRADPALHDVPAILVSSRSSPEDLQRGRDVRAQGYMIKSEFDQTKLLQMIRSLTE